jgi:hypothetical protein
MKTYTCVEVYVALKFLALDGGKWSVYCPGCFTPGSRRLGVWVRTSKKQVLNMLEILSAVTMRSTVFCDIMQ